MAIGDAGKAQIPRISAKPAASSAGGSAAIPLPRPRLTGYGRFVRFLRITLPIIALMMIGLVAAWPQIAPKPNEFRLDYADLDISDDDLSMVGARFVATDEEQRPFSISARTVRDLVPGGNDMRLEAPEAEITLTDGAWVWATADEGHYRVDDEQLTLIGSVRLFHDGGHVLSTSEAEVDLASGVVSGSAPVKGHGPLGELRGEGFRVSDSGQRIMLTGRSVVIIYPGAMEEVH